MTRRGGVSSLEVLIAAVLSTILGLGMFALVTQGTREAAASEDYMFAEAVAQRVLADAMSLPWDELEEQLGVVDGVWTEVAREQTLREEDLALRSAFQEYGRNLGTEEQGLEVSCQAQQVAPGLVAFEVSLSWPAGPAGRGRRRYAVMRLRTRKDRAVSSNFRILMPVQEEDS
jgi:hypothetical protein